MKYYSIGQFASKIGKTIQALRNWGKIYRYRKWNKLKI